MSSRSEMLRSEINRLVGKEVLLKGSNKRFKVEYMPTGILPIDVHFGGGIPRGRYVEMTGDYSTLKSYIALNTIAQVQKAGGDAALIDTEHAYDLDWAAQIGVNLDDLILAQPETGEEAIDAMELMIRNQVDFICLDSIAATLPQQEAGKKLSKETIQPGRLAALMSAAFRRLTAVNSRTGLLLINQLREQIGITFGPTEKAPGGRATGFYASMRVNMRKAGKITRDLEMSGFDKNMKTKEQIGQTYKATIEKSKLNRPWRELFFDWDLVHNRVDVEKWLMMQGLDLGIIERKGNSWIVGDLRVMGKDNFLARLRTDEEALHCLTKAVLDAYDLSSLLPGRPTRPKSKAARQNVASSKEKVLGRTQRPAQGRSSSTAPRKTKLSK
jgi:recombination protein RecA